MALGSAADVVHGKLLHLDGWLAARRSWAQKRPSGCRATSSSRSDMPPAYAERLGVRRRRADCVGDTNRSSWQDGGRSPTLGAHGGTGWSVRRRRCRGSATRERDVIDDLLQTSFAVMTVLPGWASPTTSGSRCCGCLLRGYSAIGSPKRWPSCRLPRTREVLGQRPDEPSRGARSGQGAARHRGRPGRFLPSVSRPRAGGCSYGRTQDRRRAHGAHRRSHSEGPATGATSCWPACSRRRPAEPRVVEPGTRTGSAPASTAAGRGSVTCSIIVYVEPAAEARVGAREAAPRDEPVVEGGGVERRQDVGWLVRPQPGP